MWINLILSVLGYKKVGHPNPLPDLLNVQLLSCIYPLLLFGLQATFLILQRQHESAMDLLRKIHICFIQQQKQE